MSNPYKHTFLIVYRPGSYGAFLNWCINWFSGTIDENILPFMTNGSAHRWVGYATGDVTGQPHKSIEYFLNAEVVPLSLRTHLVEFDYNIEAAQKQLILSYRQNFRKIVLITSNSSNRHMLLLHNVLTKVRDASYNNITNKIVIKYKDQFGAYDPIPDWQIREMMSYWHSGWQHYVTAMYQPIVDDKLVNVDLNNLLEHFEDCLCSLFDKLEIPMVRKNRLAEIKNQWLGLQKFKNLDQTLNDVVLAVVNNQDLDFGDHDTHMLDEAFLQWKLREVHGLDLLCFGLNKFPTNTKELRNLLIPYINRG